VGREEVLWRKNFVHGFLRGIILAKEPGEKIEILAVGHGSFFKKLAVIDSEGIYFLATSSAPSIYLHTLQSHGKEPRLEASNSALLESYKR
jgi:hypothetical protein